MGLLAFSDTIHELDAERQAASKAVFKVADVVTFGRARIVRPANAIIERHYALRQILLRSHSLLRRAVEADLSVDALLSATQIVPPKIEKAKGDIASLRATLNDAGFLKPGSGKTLSETLEEIARQWSANSTDDGRFARKLAKRAREAEEACDIHRVKLLVVLDQFEAHLDSDLLELPVEPRQAVSVAETRAIELQDLFRASIARYPVVSEYLAR